MRALLIAALLVAASPAAAQQVVCQPEASVVAVVGGKYDESKQFTMQPHGGGEPFDLWVNVETGTWSLIRSPAANSGFLCLLANGTEFDTAPLSGPGEQS